MRAWKGVFLSAALVLTATPAPAPASKAPIPPIYEEVASFHGIEDPSLLYSIALQESGRRIPGGDRIEPWPWTLNVEGQGHTYDSLEAAWDALAAHVAAGRRSIDIGLTQVNYPANDHLVVDIYGALDPRTNLRLGAEVLSECYLRLRNWWQAVGCYHSPTPWRAERYRAAVKKHWLALRSGDRS